jgi:hypothetical protein
MENLIMYIVLMKINTKISLQQYVPLSEAEANPGYFLARFQSLQPPSTQPDSSLALISPAPESKFYMHYGSVYFTVNRILHTSVLITVTGLARVYSIRVLSQRTSLFGLPEI